MNELSLSKAIESLLLSASEPLSLELISELTTVPVRLCEEELEKMMHFYIDNDRGIAIENVAGGYCFATTDDCYEIVEKYVLTQQKALKLSSAALETLAIIAYKQPVSRAQVSAIRGVNAEGAISALHEKDYIEEYGRDPGPGNAILYATTSDFLIKLGLNSVAELPPIAAFVPDSSVVEALEKSLLANE
jgi:segregation and condensation protein B